MSFLTLNSFRGLQMEGILGVVFIITLIYILSHMNDCPA